MYLTISTIVLFVTKINNHVIKKWNKNREKKRIIELAMETLYAQ